MTTKEKNAVLNLSIPKDLKEEFTQFAYKLWTNPTNLLKMLIKNTLATRQVNLRVSPFDSDDCEIEPLDTSDWWEDFNKKSYDLSCELSSLLEKQKWA